MTVIFLLKYWKLIAGGLAVVALAVALMLARADAQHWHKLADQRASTIEQVKVASAAADAAARKAIADTEARYKEHADATQAQYADAAATARTDADAYSAAHRVPACAGGATRGTPASPQGGSASVPADLSASAIVGDADVRACSGAAAYALAAHSWAVGLANETVTPQK